MSFAFPDDPSEGTYAGILHDEFVTTSNWWVRPTGPTDIWTQRATAGDAWNAHASSGSGVVGPSGAGFITLNRGLGSVSDQWVFLRSWGRVPSNGAQVMWETPSTTYSLKPLISLGVPLLPGMLLRAIYHSAESTDLR